jgi:anti-sigma regulatory factor (Ser/Thr protein kinase)
MSLCPPKSLDHMTQPTIELTSAWLSAGDLLKCQFKMLAWALSPDTGVRRARRLLRGHLTSHISDEVVLDDLEVVVSELATNAMTHTEGPAEMRILHHGEAPVVCEIADTGGGLDEIAQHLRRHARSADAE